MKLIAINVLMDPDPATAERARAVNALLRSNYPAGFALDANHAPHVTLVQCFVFLDELSAVAAAVAGMLKQSGPFSLESRAVGYYALTHENLGLMGIVIEPTAELRRVQGKVIEALLPYSEKNGTGDAFAPRGDGAPIGQPTVDYVNDFVGPRTGDNYNPHLTVGIAKSDFVDGLKAEPFEAFAVRPVSISLYQLGDYGVAQRKLHDLHRF